VHVVSVIHYPTYGGPHHRTAALIPELARRGITSSVVIPSEDGNARGFLVDQGIDVHCLRFSRLRATTDPRTHLRFAAAFRREVRQLRGLIRQLQADVVVVNGLVNPHAAIAGRLENRAVVWQLLDIFAPMPFRRAMMPMVSSLADAVMSSGRTVGELHPGAPAFGERFVPFFSVVDTERFRNSAEARAKARGLLGLSPNALVVGNVSNLNPMKGHDLFIKAAGAVLQHRPDVKFVILGAQSERHSLYLDALWHDASHLGLRKGDNLIVMDPGRDVATFAPALDVFWLTSPPRSEGVSTVIGEAMSLEIPVVATAVGSVVESVADGVTGSLVPPLSPEALARATLPYLDDSTLRARAGQAGRVRAKALFSVERCADLHEKAFRLAVEHRRAASGAS
jgi:glycosyltransferase involved in cell wall biosynthesis